jgi:hypothetical protein
MKPRDDDVAKPPNLVVPLGQEAEYLPMVGGLDRSEPGRPQSSDGHRQRIVGVVLVGAPGAEHPHPRGQRRRHIEDMFARADELLGQEITMPPADSTAHVLLPRGSAQANNCCVCCEVARTLISANCCSSRPIATAVWDAL